jgi:hypothetical protein
MYEGNAFILPPVYIMATTLVNYSVRCQGPNGPGGPLGSGLGIRLSPYLGVK